MREATRRVGPAPRARRPQRSQILRRRRRVLLLAIVVLGLVVGVPLISNSLRSPAGTELSLGNGQSVFVPVDPSLSPLRKRIVELAEKQVGYHSDPGNTYCNRFSAFWYSGTSDCGNANLDEQWCADFAAWVWREAGARVVYQYIHGDLNSSSASFYEWGMAQGSWHPVGSSYVPVPGDVAVYGLDTATLVAAHVAVVIGKVPGSRGPIAVNGDGDLTAFSAVEVRANEYEADTHPAGAALAGYVSPTP